MLKTLVFVTWIVILALVAIIVIVHIAKKNGVNIKFECPVFKITINKKK